MCCQIRSVFLAVLLLFQAISSRASDAASPVSWQDAAIFAAGCAGLVAIGAGIWQAHQLDEAMEKNEMLREQIAAKSRLLAEHTAVAGMTPEALVDKHNAMARGYNALKERFSALERAKDECDDELSRQFIAFQKEKEKVDKDLELANGRAAHFSKELNALRVAHFGKDLSAVENPDGEEKEKKGTDVIWRKAFDPYIGRVPPQLARLLQFMCDPELRATYKADNVLPPRGILLVGPADSGKSFLCKLFVDALKAATGKEPAFHKRKDLIKLQHDLLERNVDRYAEEDLNDSIYSGGAVVVADGHFFDQQEVLGLNLSNIGIGNGGVVAFKANHHLSELFEAPITCCIACVRTKEECPQEFRGPGKFEEVIELPPLSEEDMGRVVGGLIGGHNPALKPADNSLAFMRAVSYFAQKEATVPYIKSSLQKAMRENVHTAPLFSGEQVLRKMLELEGVKEESEAVQKENFDNLAKACNTDENQGVDSEPSGSSDDPQK